MVDEVRRRVQQETLGLGAARAIRSADSPALQMGAVQLTEKPVARLDAKLALGSPDHEVNLAWQCYQTLRNIYRARPERGGKLVD